MRCVWADVRKHSIFRDPIYWKPNGCVGEIVHTSYAGLPSAKGAWSWPPFARKANEKKGEKGLCGSSPLSPRRTLPSSLVVVYVATSLEGY